MIIQNATVLHVDSLQEGSDIRIADGRILQIGPRLPPSAGEQVMDGEGLLALPGLIDIHTHGLKSESVQDGSLREYSRLQLEQGVTACIPTLYGSPKENILRIKESMWETDDLRATPNLLGFRPEIMYVAKTGAGSTESLSAIDSSVSESLYDAAKGKILIWDVSAELAGAIHFVTWAVRRGIVVSLAHTRASIEQARAAVDAGLSLVTHLYDTFEPPTENDAGVYPAGLTDYVQVEDRVTAEIIPDGVHVHPLLVEKTLRCKGLQRVVFVTDSLRGSGNPTGTYEGLMPSQKIVVTTNRGMRRVGDDALSGSCLTHLQCLRNAVWRFGRSIPEASMLCSGNPARLLRLKKGRLTAGMDADIILLDRDLSLVATILGGEIVYRGASSKS